MKKRVFIFCLIALPAIFLTIKVNHYLLGRRILGETDGGSAYLKIVPINRNPKSGHINSFFPVSLAQIKFNLPRTDTIKTSQKKNTYKSFKFSDSSIFEILKDTKKLDAIHILTSTKYPDYNIIDNYLKDNKISSNFDLLLAAYRTTPDDLSFFNISGKKAMIYYTLLKLKSISLANGWENGFCYFKLRNLKGFQYGKPSATKRTFVELYTNDADEYILFIEGFKQEQIDYVILSIDESMDKISAPSASLMH